LVNFDPETKIDRMDEKTERSSSAHGTLVEDARPRKKSFTDIDENRIGAAFENPLDGLSKEQLFADVETFCRDSDLMEYLEEFKKGALVAQSPYNTKSLSELNDEDRNILEREHTHRWNQPFMLWCMAFVCCTTAAVRLTICRAGHHVFVGGSCTG